MVEYPFVSIIIPTSRSQEVLRQCLDSLEKQTYSKDKIEVILVSSCSIEVKTSLTARVVAVGPEAGYAVARNKGVEQAKGELLAFIDDDCVVPKYWLVEATRIFQRNAKIALVGGPAIPFEQDTVRYRAGGYILRSPFLVGFVSSRYRQLPRGFETRGEHLILANTVVARAAFEAIGGFNAEQIPCEDGYFYFRLREKGYTLWYAPEVFVRHRAKPVFAGICKRVFLYGLGRGGVTARNWRTLHLAYLLPSFFVLSLAALPFLAIFSPVFFAILFLELGLYFLFNIASSLFIFFRLEKNAAIWLLVLLATPLVHLSYGLGVFYGIYAHFAKKGKNEMSLLRKFEV